jgi:hypothetical protein
MDMKNKNYKIEIILLMILISIISCKNREEKAKEKISVKICISLFDESTQKEKPEFSLLIDGKEYKKYNSSDYFPGYDTCLFLTQGIHEIQIISKQNSFELTEKIKIDDYKDLLWITYQHTPDYEIYQGYLVYRTFIKELKDQLLINDSTFKAISYELWINGRIDSLLINSEQKIYEKTKKSIMRDKGYKDNHEPTKRKFKILYHKRMLM